MHELRQTNAAKQRIDHEARHKSLVDLVKDVWIINQQTKTNMWVNCILTVIILVLTSVTIFGAARMCM